jgi:ABC-type multidrug transport system fused ATPase/permease subunit
VGAVGVKVFRQYMGYFAPGLLVALLFVLALGRHLSSLGMDLWLVRFTNGAEVPLHLFLIGYVLLALLLNSIHLFRAYFFLSRGLEAGKRIHQKLLRGIFSAPMRFFESTPTGRILNRFSRDLEAIERDLPANLIDVSHCGLDIVIVCVLLLFLEPLSVLILLPIFFLYFRLHKQFRPTSRECQRLESISRSPIFSQFSESIAGVETLRADNLRKPFQAQFLKNLDINTQVSYALCCSNRWLGIRLELLAAMVLLSVGLVASLAIASSQATIFSTAAIGLLLTYTIAIGGSMNWLVRSLALAESNLTSFERVKYYTETDPESESGEAPPDGWPSAGEIKLHQLKVRYRPELMPVLNDLCAHIPAGSRVGIVGRTGSGKSSLILSMSRILEPSSGYIEIDGVNVSTLKLETLRSALTVVPQEPVLFSGSLREALDPMQRVSDQAIEKALRRVELYNLVESLPNGLNTQVQEAGSNFSSGQRQLFCLARALLSNSKIIIMDEATASIDVQTDSIIQRTIRREFAGVTVLVIAHRLGTVIDSDIIMVLEAGRIVEMGKPEELLAKSGSVLGKLIKEIQLDTAPA